MGKSSTPKTTTQVVQNQTQLSPEQKQLLGMAIPLAQRTGNSSIAAPNFSGIAPLDFRTIQGANSLYGTAQGMANFVPQLMQRQSWAMDPNQVFNQNGALDTAIKAAQRPLVDQYQSQIMPTIRSSSADAGAYGSSRQGVAEGIAARSLMNQLGDVSATMSNAAFDTSMDTFSKALALAPQSMQAGQIPAMMMDASGRTFQDQQQMGLDEAVQKHYANMLLPLQIGQNIAGMAFGMPGSNVSTATGPGAQQPSALMRGLGGASTGASIGNMIVPGAGGAVGAGIGALIGLFG